MDKTSWLVLLLLPFLIIGCSDGSPAKHKREAAYFDRFVNPQADFNQAEQKMGELKLLVSNEKYHMRYALFDNGKFFYQVDNLGSGNGKWSYREGTLNLFANRTMFDIDLTLMATEETGDGLALQFLDRFGNNTVKVQFKEAPVQKRALRNYAPNAIDL